MLVNTKSLGVGPNTTDFRLRRILRDHLWDVVWVNTSYNTRDFVLNKFQGLLTNIAIMLAPIKKEHLC